MDSEIAPAKLQHLVHHYLSMLRPDPNLSVYLHSRHPLSSQLRFGSYYAHWLKLRLVAAHYKFCGPSDHPIHRYSWNRMQTKRKYPTRKDLLLSNCLLVQNLFRHPMSHKDPHLGSSRMVKYMEFQRYLFYPRQHFVLSLSVFDHRLAGYLLYPWFRLSQSCVPAKGASHHRG